VRRPEAQAGRCDACLEHAIGVLGTERILGDLDRVTARRCLYTRQEAARKKVAFG